MIIFNTTFHVSNEKEQEFLLWLKSDYIPQATVGDLLKNPRLCRIVSQHFEEGESYSLQFEVQNGEILSKWQKEIGHLLHQKMISKFGQQVAGFHTLLEVLL